MASGRFTFDLIDDQSANGANANDIRSAIEKGGRFKHTGTSRYDGTGNMQDLVRDVVKALGILRNLKGNASVGHVDISLSK